MKCVQNYGIISILKFENGVAMCLQPPQILISNTGDGEGLQNSNSVLQNCAKCVQNYGIISI